MRRLGSSLLLVLLGAAPLLGACFDTDLGVSHGRYTIEATLEENDCGFGYVAPENVQLEVELYSDETDVIWKIDRALPLRGDEDDAGDWTFRSDAQVPIATPDGVPTGCTLSEEETIVLADVPGPTGEAAEGGGEDGNGNGDGNEDDAAFLGTSEIVVSAAGGDCRIVLATFGGGFDQLPCRVRYALEASER